jgi:DNA-directed RNA polymerase specialized sigma24 family protein
MDTHRCSQSNPYSDQTWSDLCKRLTCYVKTLVYNSGVPAWKGQENDVVADIVQGTIEHILTYQAKVERNEAPPVGSLHHFSRKAAFRYYLDQRRKEMRLVRPETEDDADSAEEPLARFERLLGSYDPIQEKLNAMIRVESLVPVAGLIRGFPRKQRTTLLVDLAYRNDFDEELTPLEQAFYQVGISLRDYRAQRPTDELLKRRYTSSLSIAYKKLRHRASIHLCKSDFVA